MSAAKAKARAYAAGLRDGRREAQQPNSQPTAANDAVAGSPMTKAVMAFGKAALGGAAYGAGLAACVWGVVTLARGVMSAGDAAPAEEEESGE